MPAAGAASILFIDNWIVLAINDLIVHHKQLLV